MSSPLSKSHPPIMFSIINIEQSLIKQPPPPLLSNNFWTVLYQKVVKVAEFTEYVSLYWAMFGEDVDEVCVHIDDTL